MPVFHGPASAGGKGATTSMLRTKPSIIVRDGGSVVAVVLL